ncbi:hypothetical protein LARV_01540 [Longilinea arvoryzae]|uniref:Uncharacterized protein n=1 Tax=Longilinea arvoryzae TaxID=360412 RepID=A0A0S7BEB8_9CHLR|nr:hypothetical protein [Longilinea arvoryzae]GAP13785.1 hypothetical protein LARV_01540 [Longilinea arvoryzae]
MSFLSNSGMAVMAYLDPGSGSFLIQMLLAGGLGAAFLIKTYWRKIKGLFNKNNEDVSPSVMEDAHQEK